MEGRAVKQEPTEGGASHTYSDFPMVISQCAMADYSERRKSPQFLSLSPTHQLVKQRDPSPFSKSKALHRKKVEAILRQGLPHQSGSPEEEDKGDELSNANITNQFLGVLGEKGRSPDSEVRKSVPPTLGARKNTLKGATMAHNKSAHPHAIGHHEHLQVSLISSSLEIGWRSARELYREQPHLLGLSPDHDAQDVAPRSRRHAPQRVHGSSRR